MPSRQRTEDFSEGWREFVTRPMYDSSDWWRSYWSLVELGGREYTVVAAIADGGEVSDTAVPKLLTFGPFEETLLRSLAPIFAMILGVPPVRRG